MHTKLKSSEVTKVVNKNNENVTCPDCKGKGEVKLSMYLVSDIRKKKSYFTDKCYTCDGKGSVSPKKAKAFLEWLRYKRGE